MALIVVFQNVDGTDDSSDYKVQVLVGDGTERGSTVLATGEVKGHDRAKGWAALVQEFLDSEGVAKESEQTAIIRSQRGRLGLRGETTRSSDG